MDAELKAFLENFSNSFERRFLELEGSLRELESSLLAELRDIREEVRTVKSDRRETVSRVDRAVDDYREARRNRELRTLSLEGRVEEIERRLNEGGL